MPAEALHRFEQNDKRYAIDPETCFCFECDEISWDVLEHYPDTTTNGILHLLGSKHEARELAEVVSELEWLRATKSILVARKPEEFMKEFKVDTGLKRLTVSLPAQLDRAPSKKRAWFGQGPEIISDSARRIGMDAVGLLLSRAGEKTDLVIEFLERGSLHNPDLIADLCAHALRLAALAGKRLTAAVHVTEIELARPPQALEGHTVGVKLEIRDAEGILEHMRALTESVDSLGRLAKSLQPGTPGLTGRIVVRPNHPAFGEVVPTLDKAGFKTIELDLDGAFTHNPDLPPEDMLEALSQSAVYYAQRLLKHHYFRLDPIASLFNQIHEGLPVNRSDPAGTNELAVDEDGSIYPSWRLLGVPDFRVGSVVDAQINEEAIKRFEDVGSLTTGVCRSCWVRNLCGGGCTAVHHAFSGSFRAPHERWCAMQRSWMASAVAAFNILSAEGVDFTRVYQSLGGAPSIAALLKSSLSISSLLKPAFWAKARAALKLNISLRPIQESDSETLVKWENWREASYFLCSPKSLLTATVYDREMDALHPQSFEQEMVLTRRDGTPFGLLRLAPGRTLETADVGLFMRDEADYASEDIRQGFKLALGEAGKEQNLRNVIVRALEQEAGLRAFLEALGFVHVGIMREAVYLHGGYYDLHVYALSMA